MLICRHLRACAPIDERHLGGTEPQRFTSDVDRSVSTADHGDRAADVRRASRLDRLDEGQRVPDAGKLVTGVGHIRIRTHPDGKNDGVVERLDVRERVGGVDSEPELELHAKPLECPDLLWQGLALLSVGRDRKPRESARLNSLVVHGDVESARRELPGADETGGAGADDCDGIPVSRTASTERSAAGERNIRGKPLQSPDLDWFSPLVPKDARALAKHLDGTDPRAGAAKQVLRKDRRGRSVRVVARDCLHEPRHVHARRAGSHARSLGIGTTALETPFRLDDRLGSRQRRNELLEELLRIWSDSCHHHGVWSQARPLTSGRLRTAIRGKAQVCLRPCLPLASEAAGVFGG